MNKPQGYDEAQSYTGDFEQLELGGHICQNKMIILVQIVLLIQIQIYLFRR